MMRKVEATTFANPNNPVFGPVSVVKVHTPPKFMCQLGKDKELVRDQELTISNDQSHLEEESTKLNQSLENNRPTRIKSQEEPKPQGIQKRKPVKERCHYELVPQLAMDVGSTEKQDPQDENDVDE